MSYSYSVATSADKREIEYLLLSYYLFDETLNAAAEIRDIDYIPIMKPTVERCLEKPLSFIARHKETGELAGVILNSVWERGDDEEYYATTTRTDEVAAAHDGITNELHNSFWKLVDSTAQLALHQEMSSVAIPHRRNGIASKLLKMSMDPSLLEAYTIDGIVAEASSNANQQLLSKYGFATLNALDYADYKDDNGNPLLVPKDGSTKIELKWRSTEDIRKHLQ